MTDNTFDYVEEIIKDENGNDVTVRKYPNVPIIVVENEENIDNQEKEAHNDNELTL